MGSPSVYDGIYLGLQVSVLHMTLKQYVMFIDLFHCLDIQQVSFDTHTRKIDIFLSCEACFRLVKASLSSPLSGTFRI